MAYENIHDLAKRTLNLRSDEFSSRVAKLLNDTLGYADLKATQVAGVEEKTEAFDILAADAGKYIRVDSGTAVDATVKANDDEEIPVGSKYEIVQAGDGVVTLVAASDVTINSKTGLKTDGQYTSIRLTKVATDEWDALDGVA